jgi:hypothetical protein
VRTDGKELRLVLGDAKGCAREDNTSGLGETDVMIMTLHGSSINQANT